MMANAKSSMKDQFEKAGAVLKKADGTRQYAKERVVESIEVYRTKDYFKFGFLPENRKVYRKHVETMKKSLEEFGFLQSMPVHVIKRPESPDTYFITDGQHRFLAAKNLGVEIYFTVRERGTAEDDVKVMHTFSRGWKNEDYLHHFCQLGRSEYHQLSKFCETYGLPIAVALTVLNRNIHKVSRHMLDAFREGRLNFKPEVFAEMSGVMDKVNEIRYFHERMKPMQKDYAFIRAIVLMVVSKDYDHERFIKNLERQLMTVVRCTTLEQYLEMLTDIYNFHLRQRNRVVFTRRGSRTAAADVAGFKGQTLENEDRPAN